MLLPRGPSPLRVEVWEEELCRHPDQEFVCYLVAGISHGFRVGASRSGSLKPASRNMLSASQHPEVVEAYLQEEVSLGRLLPLPPGVCPQLHISRFGVIPKSNNPGKWRLITDLSSPDGYSVNDRISPRLCSLEYITVDMVAKRALQLGKGALLAKADVKSAYRIVLVHPQDIPLLGVAWNGVRYADRMLPFGLRSACKIFTALADALEWCCIRRGAQDLFHYLDDFVMVGPPGTAVCASSLRVFQEECRMLGVPLAPEKTEGPSTCLTLLGIEIDIVACELRLPAEKLQRLKVAVKEWQGRRSCTKRELESLVGFLQHAATVVRPGHSFLRRMFELVHTVREQHHHIRLNSHFRADLSWWALFAESWNDCSLATTKASVTVTSDASGSWGCGAYLDDGYRWFQWEWPEQARSKAIAVKELYPILIAAACWGSRWKGRTVLCRCDNMAIVQVLSSRYCRDRDLMHLFWCLFFFEASVQCAIIAEHVAGVANGLADDLSRNRLNSFLLQVPAAQEESETILPTLIGLLLTPDAQWASQSWMKLFYSIVIRV